MSAIHLSKSRFQHKLLFFETIKFIVKNLLWFHSSQDFSKKCHNLMFKQTVEHVGTIKEKWIYENGNGAKNQRADST